MQKIKKVLVVEDDLSLWPMWEVILHRCLPSAQIEWAVSAEEARRMVREASQNQKPFAVIISDLFLAGSGTGVELLQSEDVQLSGASTVLVSMAEIEKMAEDYQGILPKTLFISKPLNVVKCERLMSPIFEREIA